MEVLLQRSGNHLVASDVSSEELICAMRDKEVVTATIRRSRNAQHHRLFFALLQAVFENQSRFPTMEHLLDQIKIYIGHYDIIKVGENEVFKTRSISFSRMDQTAFEQFYDKVIDLVCSKILPNTKSEELKRRVEELL